ncbi:MAG: hypothetical protein WC479_05420 [Candidatus Izemoplasmatales bacterium]|jgi:hypothetical protein
MKTAGYVALLVAAILVTAGISGSVNRASAAPIQLAEGMSAEWKSGGWEITSNLTDTATKEGTEITLTAEATYYRDGVQERSEAVPVVLTVGKSEYKKEWITTQPISANLKLSDTKSGSGGAEILPDGKLKWWVTASNDGTPATFTFKLVLK